MSDEFHREWYHSGLWKHVYWKGIRTLKCPLDLWVYQEIIHELNPSLIVECGTNRGGTSLFLADVSRAQVVTIDITKRHVPQHPRIHYLTGNSTDPEIVDHVKRFIKAGHVLVILDSNHSKAHVLNELEAYHSIVTKGSYLIVEDTNLNNPVDWPHGDGPNEALQEWMPKHPEFEVDRSREKFLLTFNPGGYLRRI